MERKNVVQKFKRHKQIDYNEYIERLLDDLEGTDFEKDFRSISLTMHLFTEYWLNEILIAGLPQPQIVIDNPVLSDFQRKLDILQSMNTIEDPKLLKNIKQIQEIRNLYAHNLIPKNEINPEILFRIEKMDRLSDDELIKNNLGIPQQRYFSFGIQTLVSLSELCARVREQGTLYPSDI